MKFFSESGYMDFNFAENKPQLYYRLLVPRKKVFNTRRSGSARVIDTNQQAHVGNTCNTCYASFHYSILPTPSSSTHSVTASGLICLLPTSSWHNVYSSLSCLLNSCPCNIRLFLQVSHWPHSLTTLGKSIAYHPHLPHLASVWHSLPTKLPN